MAKRAAGKLRIQRICLWVHLVLALGLSLCISSAALAQQKAPRFRVVALAEAGGIHKPFVDAATEWLNALAKQDGFAVDYIQNTDKIDDAFLSHYQLFIQLNYPPYNWTPTAQAAFVRYIEEGRGGWIGFHHATLLGEFDGFEMWRGSLTSWAAFVSRATFRSLRTAW